MPGAISPIRYSTPGIKEMNMSLTPEQQAFLAELKINRPDLIQQLKAEFDEERAETLREWDEAHKDLESTVRLRAKMLAGL